MRILKLSAGTAALMYLALVPVAAQRGNSGNHGPTNHPSPPPNAGPKTAGPSTHSTGPSSHGPVDAGSSAKNTGGGSSKNPHTSGTSTTTTASTTTINFAGTPVGQKLTRNTALQSKLATNLHALGYQGTVFEAAYGFKNLGQFVAATNVARNLGIPFDQLKLLMTGVTVDASGNVVKTTAPTKSLGQSIQALKPTANATNTAKTATEEAENEIDDTSHAPTTTTTSPTHKDNRKKS